MNRHLTTTSVLRVLGVALLAAAGCGTSSPGATGSAGTSGGGTAGTSGGGTAGTSGGGTAGTNGGGTAGGSGGISPTGTAGTTGAGGLGVGTSQCSDGRDNDGDGKIDYDDPECIGPLVNDEGSFATGIPGDNMDPCRQDCFFDGNSGQGDDKCLWQLQCDPMNTNTRCPYDATYAAQHATECSTSMSQSQACVTACRKLVPNGCDCFGCCVVPGAPAPILLTPTCTAADFNDPAKCPRCTQVTQCSNPCERCEICIGKPTLPADCTPDGGTDGPPPNNCGSDYVPCGPGTPTPADGCGPNYGCVTGCCIPNFI
jgi:hypothetical protein